jgi:hypothetical protein
MAAPNYSDFHTISIDFDVFKALTAQLDSPSDSYNSVLRRLLDLPTERADTSVRALPDARSWLVGGATFPHGTEFRAKYKGANYTARVEGGALVYNGERYASPSPAAMAITHNSVNGWIFWECRLPGRSAWVLIDSLRRK